MSLNKHHHRALYVLLATLCAILFMGVLTGFAHHVSTWHGIYCATGFATTAGCDLPMTSPADYILGEISMVLMIPLLTSAFSFLTTALLADHMEQAAPQDPPMSEQLAAEIRAALARVERGQAVDLGSFAQAPDAARTARQRGQGQVPAGPVE